MTEPAATPIDLQKKLLPWLYVSLRQLKAASTARRLGHAWLISGPKGIGKLNLSLVFADWLFSGAVDENEPDVLKPGEARRAMEARNLPYDHHADLHRVFPAEDKATISVEQIRAVSEALELKSFSGTAKLVIVEPADALTIAAANALLKTLEEPAESTYLLLLSERPDLLPATIRSRCQKLPLRRPPTVDIEAWLRLEADDGERIPMSDPYVASLSPLVLAEARQDGRLSETAELESRLQEIHDREADPLLVAEEWVKSDLDHILGWMVTRIQIAIRERMTPGGSKRVTESPHDHLHNSWAGMALQKLFEQLEKAEMLRNRLDTGMNAELALRVLLLGFRSDRDKA